MFKAFFSLDPEKFLFPILSQAFANGEYQKLITRLTRFYGGPGKTAFFRKAYALKDASLSQPPVDRFRQEFMDLADEASDWDLNAAFEMTAGYLRMKRVGDLDAKAKAVAERDSLLQSLMSPRKTPRFDHLRKKAQKQGIDFSKLIEDQLPSALYGVKGVLKADVLPIDEDHSYVSLDKIVFSAGHYCVSRSKVEGYESELRHSAAMPSVTVVPQEDGTFLIEEGHHRATTSYLSGADYVKVRIISKDIAYGLPRSPFKSTDPISIKFILLTDKSWEEEV